MYFYIQNQPVFVLIFKHFLIEAITIDRKAPIH
jgi:hypothetical protein